MAFTREQIIDKVKKLQEKAISAAKIGSSEEAEAFAAMANEFLLKHEITEGELDTVTREKNEPVIRIEVQRSAFNIELKKVRVEWQERLAAMVGAANLCRILIQSNSNRIWFVGTETNATVAEYTYGTLVPLVSSMSKRAELEYWKATGCGRGADNQAKGYRNSWINGFISRMRERLREAREAAVHNSGIDSSTALVRLDNSLARVDNYMSKLATKTASGISGRGSTNADGHYAGRAAADKIQLNKGVAGHRDTTRKLN